MPITIRDVAKRLNLSITTVSRALDGYSDVSEETRQKVIKMAREMGYVPNRAARQLRKQRTQTLGYILPTSVPRFSDPFFSDFFSGIGDEAARHGYELLIACAQPGEDAERIAYQQWVHGRKVDGFILNRMRLRDWRVQYLATSNIPFVTLERTLDPLDYPSVEVDGQAGIEVLVEHLVKKGCKRIGFIGASPDLAIHADRYSGYRLGLQKAGLPFDQKLVVEGNLTRDGGYQAAKKLLAANDQPIALVCINDLTAIGAIRCAQEMGLDVGKEVMITGFDGIEEGEHSMTSLTTLSQPIYEIAKELVRLLVAEIDGVSQLNRRRQIHPQLVLRASTG